MIFLSLDGHGGPNLFTPIFLEGPSKPKGGCPACKSEKPEWFFFIMINIKKGFLFGCSSGFSVLRVYHPPPTSVQNLKLVKRACPIAYGQVLIEIGPAS